MPKLQDILSLVGELNYTWTNTESLLIYLIAGLSGTDKETAIVIFLTLNTSRARIDLVERLAKLPRIREDCRDQVLAVTARMQQESKLRNKFNHCIYSFDPGSGQGMTQLMRIFDAKTEIRYGKVEMLDDAEMDRIRSSIGEITAINNAIWQIVREHRFPT